MGVRGRGDDERVEQRLRVLIQAGALPSPMPRRMFVGKCLEAHSCIACDSTIHVDEPECEWTNTAGLILYFHRRCVEIYRALSDGHVTR